MPAIFLLLAACGGGSSGGDGSSASGNSVPVANAGLDQNITVGVPVELDGSASSDADGDALTYSWALTSKPNGSSALLASPTSESPTFVPDLAGSYALSLTVNDGKRDSATSSLTLEAVSSNSAPVANAGRGQNVLVGATVELDGSTSSDADGDALTYSWALTSKPNGSSALLSSPTSVSPTFVPDLTGSYVASLTVNDGKEESLAAIVELTASFNDTSGPTVSAITVNPSTVDVSVSSQSVTATVVVNDATGVDLNRLPRPYWYNVDDLQGTRINGTWELVAGDSKEATLRSKISIPAGAKPGDWLVGSTAFYDVLGYSSTNGGYSQSFIVKSF